MGIGDYPLGTFAKDEPKKDVNKDDIMDAVKLIASLKPVPVQPFSIGFIGGVKIISSPFVPEGSILVSDDIWRDLQKISNNINKENPDATS